MILELILLSLFGSKKGKKDVDSKKAKDSKKPAGKPDKKDAGKGKKGR